MWKLSSDFICDTSALRLLNEYGLRIKEFQVYPNGELQSIRFYADIKGRNLGNINRKLQRRKGIRLYGIFHRDGSLWQAWALWEKSENWKLE